MAQLGRKDEAIAAYDRALKERPAYPEALVNRGMALVDRGKGVDALNDFRRALALRPDYLAARVGAARAHGRLNQVPDALAEIDKVLAIDPVNRDALLVKTNVLRDAERPEEALALDEAMLAQHPDDAAWRISRAFSLAKLKRFDEALAAADAAADIDPKDSEVHLVRGMALSQLGRRDEAWRAFDLAERHGGTGIRLHQARAIALGNMGRHAEAVAVYDRIIEEDPDDAAAHHFRSLALLTQGDYENGWAEHEWRLKAKGFTRTDMLKVAPLWKGEDVTAKKVLLYSEQGAGDTIQFARLAPLVAARGARVSMVVHELLRRLFAANFPDMDVSEDIGLRTGFDYQAPLMSLPHILRVKTPEAIPAAVPYLVADPARVAKWAGRLGPEGFKVGISWQGNNKYAADHFRSVPLKHFAPLAGIPGVRLISVQALWGTEQLQDLPAGMTVETLGEELVNNPDGFREMAAVMAAVDLMIVSDSAPAHLAGALGRPVWVALHDHPDWRWLVGRSDSPWYPTMRLFRQDKVGDWGGVFDRIAAALAAAVRDGGPR